MIQYARCRDGQLAYVLEDGDGPVVLSLVGTGSTVFSSTLAPAAATFDRVRRYARLLLVEPRGTGRSDPLPPDHVPTTEELVADLVAILDDAGVDKAWVWAVHAGVPLGIALAADHPGRVEGLVLLNGWARLLEADDIPFGISPRLSERVVTMHGEAFGTGVLADMFVPSRRGDPVVKQFVIDLESSLSRAQSMLLTRWAQELDVRDRLGQVRAPALVVHVADNRLIPADHGRYLASRIPDATYVEVPGTDHLPYWQSGEEIGEECEAFITGVRPRPRLDREFAAIVFTDIVGSTELAARMGDRDWRELLDRHDAMVRRQIDRFDGREVKTTGDGFLVTFIGPTPAVRCAKAIRDGAAQLGISVRSGVHTGEVELRGEDIGGIAVHVAQRVASLAGSDEVCTSGTVKDLVFGSGISFEDRGEHELKGVPDRWRVFVVQP